LLIGAGLFSTVDLRRCILRGIALSEAKDKENRTLAQFAVASRNNDLLQYLQGKVDFEGALAYAVEFWHWDAFQ
jgi:hypothetical protein